MKRVFLAISLLAFSGFCRAQIPEEARDAVEKYLENTETDADFTQMLDELTAYLERPIRINSATLDELLRFPLISPVQALAIIQHRQKYGLFLHLHELQVAG